MPELTLSLTSKSLSSTNPSTKSILPCDTGILIIIIHITINVVIIIIAPFALDYNPYHNVRPATGFRHGGPKEARLFRVSMLKSDRETEHLFPVKVINVPPNVKHHQLNDALKKYGTIGDVYIPIKNLGIEYSLLQPIRNTFSVSDIDGERHVKVGNFGIVRFHDKESQINALYNADKDNIYIDGYKLQIFPHEPQLNTPFSMSTGSLGICNIPFDDGKKIVTKSFVPQDIKLSDCLSRNGYPWGSKRELKLLEPHAPKETMNYHSLKVSNLDKQLTEADIKEVFEKYGEVGIVYCPKPIHVNLRTKDGNSGYAFVRYVDKRDLNLALEDCKNGKVIIANNVIKAEYTPPTHWPSDKTRRYW